MSQIKVSWAQLIVPMTVVRYFEFPTGGIVLGGGTQTVKYHSLRFDECTSSYRCAVSETDQFCTKGRLVWSRQSPSDQFTYALVPAFYACENGYKYPQDKLVEVPLELPFHPDILPDRIVPNPALKKYEQSKDGLPRKIAEVQVNNLTTVSSTLIKTQVFLQKIERQPVQLQEVGEAAVSKGIQYHKSLSNVETNVSQPTVLRVPIFKRRAVNLRRITSAKSPKAGRTSAMVAKITSG